MKSTYGIFTTIELARILSIIPKNLEYDLTWDKGTELHKEFEFSEFNDFHEDEYGCIEKFLKNYRREHIVEIIPTATNNDLIIYGVESHCPIHTSAKAHNLLINDEYIHFNGKEWLYFDSDTEYITEFAKKHE
jgi:hypothetical protein